MAVNRSGMMSDVEVMANPPEPGLDELAREAGAFLQSRGWCKRIDCGYLYRGWEDMLGVFLYDVHAGSHGDVCLWVVVGDVPPAILFVSDFPSGDEAIFGYADKLERWAEMAEAGEPLGAFMPILERGSFRELSPTQDVIDLVKRRARLVRMAHESSR